MSKAPFNEKAESQHLTATRVADGEARRALWGWSPPPLPAQTAWARRVDRFAPSTGLRCLAFLVGIVADGDHQIEILIAKLFNVF